LTIQKLSFIKSFAGHQKLPLFLDPGFLGAFFAFCAFSFSGYKAQNL